MYDYTQSYLPTQLSQIITPNYDIHTHQTKHHNDIHIDYRHSDVLFVCPLTWLNLPQDINISPSHNAFNRKIKQYYIKIY